MAAYVLDASAVLAALFGEPGAERINAMRAEATISAVNLCEVTARLTEEGMADEAIASAVKRICPHVTDFDVRQATLAGRLRRPTRSLGLSLGDRACLALAITGGAIAVTADRIWASLDLDVQIVLIR